MREELKLRTSTAVPCLMVRAGSRRSAIPIADVVETMRPLPQTTMPRMPRGVTGIGVVRGQATIVIDLGVMFGEPPGGADRWVTVRADRATAIAARVTGVASIDRADLHAGEALVAGVAASFVVAVVTMAGEATAVLDVRRMQQEITERATMPSEDPHV